MRFGLGAVIFGTTLGAALLAAGLGAAPTVPKATAPTDELFERSVRPILSQHCFSCHGPRVQQGGIRLDSAEAFRKSALVSAANPAHSRLLEAVRYQGSVKMPPGGKLPDPVIADLEAWVRKGAHWPATTTPESSPNWALEPVRRPSIPPVRQKAWVRTPVDAFLLSRLEAAGLSPNPPADRRTLLRRVTFDLTGLPPTPEELSVFEQDRSPEAYPKVIERLLASPHYGEKWGRRWLDVVRYADTAGETADFPAPQAWRYRNYVIDAFNKDKPYDEFLREQIAGDLLARQAGSSLPPERYAECVTATGYLAIARRFGFDSTADQYLTLEDTIDTLGKSVLGLTVGCARCHDHKYDPITTADYYALYGIFDSTRFSFPGCEKEKQPRDLIPLLPPGEAERRTAGERARVGASLNAVEAELKAARAPVDAALAQTPAWSVTGDIPDGGAQDIRYPTLTSVRVHKGDFIQLDVLPKANHGADSTLVELEITDAESGRAWNVARDVLADEPRWGKTTTFGDAFGNRDVWLAYDMVPSPTLFTRRSDNANGTPGLLNWRGEGSEPLILINTRKEEIPYFTSRMPARSFGVHPGPHGGVGLAWRSPFDGVVSVRGRISDLHPGGGDGVAWGLEQRPGFAEALPRIADLNDRAISLRAELTALKDQSSGEMAYGVTEGTPHNVKIQLRGDPAVLGAETPRRFLQCLGAAPVSDGTSGRLQLAQWLTAPTNPLTARVMANRIWQGHFGRGLVATANDFGARGARPTHPELLDWLADAFAHGRAPGAEGPAVRAWSIKDLHRMILLSSAYQESSGAASSAGKDPENRLLGRFPRRRLSAEEIRDALLTTSGDLDPTPGGAHPFPPPSQWNYTQHAPFLAVYETNRRSVYLMTQRIRRHPFLALFDGADPSASTPERQTTTVPTQALFFMNDPFLHARAASLAARVLKSPDDRTRLDQAYLLLYGRRPSAAEQQDAAAFLRDYTAAESPHPAEESVRLAWSAYARVLFSSSEFLYVD